MTDKDTISSYKRQKLYSNGVKRYNNSMDLVNLLKTVRQTKVYFRTQLKQKQRALLQVQREEVIDSDSHVSEDHDFGMEYAMDDMKSEDPMRRMFALGRAKRALSNYDEKEELTAFDKRLLKGFYTKDKWELVNSSEEESLKFSAKIDRGRVRGLISRYLKDKDRGQN